MPCPRPQHRAIVADSNPNRTTASANTRLSRRSNDPPDLLDQFSFRKWHSAITIPPQSPALGFSTKTAIACPNGLSGNLPLGALRITRLR
jgi:hypothetical protein